jgi:hypothetical protein
VTRPTVALAAIKEALERYKLYANGVEADPPSGKYSVSSTQGKALEVNVARPAAGRRTQSAPGSREWMSAVRLRAPAPQLTSTDPVLSNQIRDGVLLLASPPAGKPSGSPVPSMTRDSIRSTSTDNRN